MAKFAVFAFALSVIALSSGASSKVKLSLLYKLQTEETADIVVSFDGNRAPLAQASLMISSSATAAEKRSIVRQSLQAHANHVQQNALSLLNRSGAEFHSYWVNNKLFVKNAGAELIQALSQVSEVAEIREQKIIQLESPIVEARDPFARAPLANEWGIENIHAHEAWAAGFTGKGVVVGVIDSGVRATHETLASNFRADHGWYDPYDKTEAPIDKVGHGTHCAGTILGSSQIGVAPDAQLIACRGCNTASCTEDALVGCGQWVVAPTNPDGSDANPALAPNVVSNSWGGGKGDAFYDGVVRSWNAAGIIPVFAIGNSGPGCETANSPGDRANLISVGSTNSFNGVSLFSSKGPSVDGKIKPEVCAPGTNIRSAFHTSDTAYSTLSGTSMATPHVSGVVALMLSANKKLSFAQVDDILKNHNDRNLAATRACGEIESKDYPNNSYGHGKVNALKAATAAAALA